MYTDSFFKPCFECPRRDACNDTNATAFAYIFEHSSREQQDALLGLCDDLGLVYVDYRDCEYDYDSLAMLIIADAKLRAVYDKSAFSIRAMREAVAPLYEQEQPATTGCLWDEPDSAQN